MLGGNFLYTSDIFFDPEFINKIASVFARKFKDSEADYVATVETKGIPLAASVAHLLNPVSYTHLLRFSTARCVSISKVLMESTMLPKNSIL